MVNENRTDGSGRLYRSTTNKIVAGVCGGLAEHFDFDPTLVRLIFVLLVFAQGLGILLYLILWMVTPRKIAEEKSKTSHNNDQKMSDFVEEISDNFKSFTKNIHDHTKYQARRDTFALIIIVIGLVALVKELFPSFWFRGDLFGPALLIIIGAYILFKKSR